MGRALQRSGRTCNAALDPAPFIRQEKGVHWLFVYGSLKREMMHHDQLEGACFEGLALVRGHTLVWYENSYPALCESEEEDWVEGELYRVDDALLAQVDAFEECPELYQRALVACEIVTPERMGSGAAEELPEQLEVHAADLAAAHSRSALAYLITRERARRYERLGSCWRGRQVEAADSPRTLP